MKCIGTCISSTFYDPFLYKLFVILVVRMSKIIYRLKVRIYTRGKLVIPMKSVF